MELVDPAGPRLRAGRAQQGRGATRSAPSRSTRSSRRSRKVNFTVTNARVGQRTDYDKLTHRGLDRRQRAARRTRSRTPRASSRTSSPSSSTSRRAGRRRRPRRRRDAAVNENLFRPVDELELSRALGQLPAERRHQVHRRAGAEDRAGDAQDQELRPQVAERDQGDPARDGARPRHAPRQLPGARGARPAAAAAREGDAPDMRHRGSQGGSSARIAGAPPRAVPQPGDGAARARGGSRPPTPRPRSCAAGAIA